MIEEARKLHPEYDFEVHNMLSLSTTSPADYFTSRLFDTILFLASYHHLASREERIQVLSDVKKLLTP